MTNELARINLQNALESSSLDDLLKDDETVMLLIDTSGSMSSRIDHREPKTCINALREIVASIRRQNTGASIPMIAFGGPYDAQVRFVDAVPDPDGGTPLHAAIPFAKEYGATRLVIISDGIPDLAEQSMQEARAFGGRIDVMYIGAPGSTGEAFLNTLAQATGGTRSTGDLRKPNEITGHVIGFLEGEVEKKAPIQGPGFTTVDEADLVEADEDDDDEEEDDDDDE